MDYSEGLDPFTLQEGGPSAEVAEEPLDTLDRYDDGSDSSIIGTDTEGERSVPIPAPVLEALLQRVVDLEKTIATIQAGTPEESHADDILTPLEQHHQGTQPAANHPLQLISTPESLDASLADIEEQIDREARLIEKITDTTTPYTEALTHEMLSRIPLERQPTKPLPPRPTFQEDPDAYTTYINKYGRRIVWEAVQDDATHRFSLTYLWGPAYPELVRFTADIPEPPPRGSADPNTLRGTLDFLFDGSQMTSLSVRRPLDISMPPTIFPRRPMEHTTSVTLGQKLQITYGLPPQLLKTPTTLTYNAQTHRFHANDRNHSPIKPRECLRIVRDILGRLPMIRPG